MKSALNLSLLLALCLSQAAAPRTHAQTSQAAQPTRAAQKSAPVEFVDVTKSAGIEWGFNTLAPGNRYLIETMGGGGGFFDYNNDGLLDIYLVCYSQTPQSDSKIKLRDVLYRNNGDGTFTDVTESARLNNSLVGMGMASADYNNDGFADI